MFDFQKNLAYSKIRHVKLIILFYHLKKIILGNMPEFEIHEIIKSQ